MKELNPKSFIDFIESIINEVFIRRAISGLYFSLFNYWSAIQYEKHGKRGKGPRQDQFEYRQFHEELLSEGLDAQLVFLFKYRLASDHYVLNPTIVKVYNQEIVNIIESNKLNVRITRDILTRAIESAKDILNVLLRLGKN